MFFILCKKPRFLLSLVFIYFLLGIGWNRQYSSQASEDETFQKPVRILCIDGGGIRGVIPLTICNYWEKKTGKRIAKHFSLIGGTSIGSIIATGLTMPANPDDDQILWYPQYTAEDLTKILFEERHHMFSKNASYRVGLWPSLYNPDSLEDVASRFYGDAKFKHSITPTATLAVDMWTTRLKIFKSWDEEESFYTKDAALASAAAPLFFPARSVASLKDQENKKRFYIDGGLLATNPTLHLLEEAKKLYPQAKNFEVVSLGCGLNEENISSRLFKVARNPFSLRDHFLEVSLVSRQSPFVEQSVAKHPDVKKYWRFNPILGSDRLALDDIREENFLHLSGVAADYIEKNAPQLDAVVQHLMQTKPAHPNNF